VAVLDDIVLSNLKITTTPLERIGLCTRMRRFLVRFIRPETFVHTRSLVDFITTTSESRFWVHNRGPWGYAFRDAGSPIAQNQDPPR